MQRMRENTFIVSTWFELVVVVGLWLLFVGGAGAMASSFYAATSCMLTVCRLANATQAFAWLTWCALTLLLAVVLFVAISVQVHSRKDDNAKNVWTHELESVARGHTGAGAVEMGQK